MRFEKKTSRKQESERETETDVKNYDLFESTGLAMQLIKLSHYVTQFP